jgi:hypothetical protein
MSQFASTPMPSGGMVGVNTYAIAPGIRAADLMHSTPGAATISRAAAR